MCYDTANLKGALLQLFAANTTKVISADLTETN
jgi:hypothetical protein